MGTEKDPISQVTSERPQSTMYVLGRFFDQSQSAYPVQLLIALRTLVAGTGGAGVWMLVSPSQHRRNKGQSDSTGGLPYHMAHSGLIPDTSYGPLPTLTLPRLNSKTKVQSMYQYGPQINRIQVLFLARNLGGL